jgi:hypothetical protein
MLEIPPRKSYSGPRMLLPFFILITLLSACSADPNCSFGGKPGREATIPKGLGVNIHFTDPKPGEIKMIAEAGFRWVRMDFKWDATEHKRGEYDFAEYDRLIAALDESKLHALLIFDYGNPLYDNSSPPRTPEARQAFARWAVAAAKHFANRGIIWEVYNEPNHRIFWPPWPNSKEYIELALTVGRAFRSELPSEKLIGPAVSEIDYSFVEECLKAGLLDYWFAVSVHPYRKSDPEGAAAEYCRVREMIKRYGGGKDIPIISGEWGYSAAWPDVSEEKQSVLFAREMLTNAANEIPLSIWYDWRDDGSDPKEPEHHFGLVRNSYQSGRDQVYEPKPAYQAASTLSRFFDSFVFERRVALGHDDDYVLIFAKGAEKRIAAWTTSNTPHRLNIPADQGDYRVIRHTGDFVAQVSAGSKAVSIEVSTAPVYLERIR